MARRRAYAAASDQSLRSHARWPRNAKTEVSCCAALRRGESASAATTREPGGGVPLRHRELHAGNHGRERDRGREPATSRRSGEMPESDRDDAENREQERRCYEHVPVAKVTLGRVDQRDQQRAGNREACGPREGAFLLGPASPSRIQEQRWNQQRGGREHHDQIRVRSKTRIIGETDGVASSGQTSPLGRSDASNRRRAPSRRARFRDRRQRQDHDSFPSRFKPALDTRSPRISSNATNVARGINPDRWSAKAAAPHARVAAVRANDTGPGQVTATTQSRRDDGRALGECLVRRWYIDQRAGVPKAMTSPATASS